MLFNEIKNLTFKWLINEAQSCINKILDKLLTNNLNLNKSICEQFDKIVKRLIQVTETPDECVESILFYENVKFVELFQLKVKLHMTYLSNSMQKLLIFSILKRT